MSEVDKAINLLRNASADWGIHRTHRNAAAAQHEHFKVLEAEERLRAQFEATRSRVRQMEQEIAHLKEQLASTTWRASLPHEAYNKEVGSE